MIPETGVTGGTSRDWLRRLAREEQAPFFSFTALVDVLFLMIIFLVLGANFDTMDTVRLPRARGGTPEATMEALRVELRADGTRWARGRRLPDDPQALLAELKALAPAAVLLLPDEGARVGEMFSLHDVLSGGLGVPVQVGVRDPGQD